MGRKEWLSGRAGDKGPQIDDDSVGKWHFVSRPGTPLPDSVTDVFTYCTSPSLHGHEASRRCTCGKTTKNHYQSAWYTGADYGARVLVPRELLLRIIT